MKAHITFLLDRSGSMSARFDDAIGGFNAFLTEQQQLPDPATLSLIQFDDQYENYHADGTYGGEFHAAPLGDFAPLTRNSYVPRGSTALLDAMARAIDETGAYLAKLADGDRPSKVIFVTLTDGYENASQKHTRSSVFGRVTHQRDAYQWEFLFIGTNQDAIAEAGAIGIPQSHALSYVNTSSGNKAAYAAASANVMRARSGMSASFTSAQRNAAADTSNDADDKKWRRSGQR